MVGSREQNTMNGHELPSTEKRHNSILYFHVYNNGGCLDYTLLKNSVSKYAAPLIRKIEVEALRALTSNREY